MADAQSDEDGYVLAYCSSILALACILVNNGVGHYCCAQYSDTGVAYCVGSSSICQRVDNDGLLLQQWCYNDVAATIAVDSYPS
jgi:hypothetical protein